LTIKNLSTSLGSLVHPRGKALNDVEKLSTLREKQEKPFGRLLQTVK